MPIAVTGADCPPPADGTTHPRGYWSEDLATPHRVVSYHGLGISIARLDAVVSAGVVPSARSA
ncbi:hypothetical protein CJ179_49885 [Rhodococcus sp. ACS1]|nr:hypothetical protein CJ179_49885 [Rhodococcus sp. ACS1]